MGTDALKAKATTIAVEHVSLSGEELLALLEYEWERAGLAGADRGPGRDYVRDVATRVFRQAKRQRDTVEVVAGMAVDSAFQMPELHHLVSDRYAMFFGLLAAWVTRAIFDDPDDHDPGGQAGPPDATGKDSG
jgi:hypothetical protein